MPIVVGEGEQRWAHEAYVPAPLPADLDLSRATWLRVVAASNELTRLDGAASRLPNPYLLVRPALTEEAVSTSALEGTYASIEDVFQVDVLGEAEVSPAAIEVRNYIAAAEVGLELIKEIPVCLRLVRAVHARLMAGARGDSAESGQFRRRQNWMGTRGDPVTESQFVPPPAGELLEGGLHDWERWINEPRDLPILVRVALAHYQFETLHPFMNGNGRVGRLVAVLMFLTSGELRFPLLNLSPYFQRYKDEYIDHLQSVSATGDFDPWIRFFSEAVRTQSTRALSKAEELTALHSEIMQTLHGAGLRGTVVRIGDDLIATPVLSPTWAAGHYDVSYETANTAIGRLAELGVLQEVTGRSYGRLFACGKVLSIVGGE